MITVDLSSNIHAFISSKDDRKTHRHAGMFLWCVGMGVNVDMGVDVCVYGCV